MAVRKSGRPEFKVGFTGSVADIYRTNPNKELMKV
jgi:hypothetical protein